LWALLGDCERRVGVSLAAPALLFALINRSAWKSNSRKFAYKAFSEVGAEFRSVASCRSVCKCLSLQRKGRLMEVFVKWEVFDTIYDREDVLALRQAVGRELQRIQQSGKLKELRAFSDARGGFMLVDVDSAGELRELIGLTMLDHFHTETHLVTTAEELAELFERDAAAG
jgi:hypothetical protein